MPSIKYEYLRVPVHEQYGEGKSLNTMEKATFESFGPNVLGLGDISKEGETVHALAAVFDLEGFTSFCNQVDAHLVVSKFLTRYLSWLFETLKARFKEGEADNRVRVWGSLPFFAKFMGDGVLLLWDTTLSGGMSGYLNIILNLWRLARAYEEDFLPRIRKVVSKAPRKLRCGVARGDVMSVGSAADYVGSCINISSRLQKLPGLNFAISTRGIDLDEFTDNTFWSEFVVRRVELRGIGDDELIYVHAPEFDRLQIEDRAFYKE